MLGTKAMASWSSHSCGGTDIKQDRKVRYARAKVIKAEVSRKCMGERATDIVVLNKSATASCALHLRGYLDKNQNGNSCQ